MYSRFPRVIVALFMMTIYSSSIAVPATLVYEKYEELSAGTVVRIALPTVPTTTLAPGQIVTGTCQSGVKVKGVTYVSPGAPVQLRVSAAEAPKGFGKPGQATLQAVSVTAVDGTEVPLSGGVISASGEDESTKTLLLGLFICFLFWFQKWGEPQFMPGATIDAYVANSVDIEV